MTEFSFFGEPSLYIVTKYMKDNVTLKIWVMILKIQRYHHI